ncbi:MAG: tetratricopeptide repeat protein [Candidatus Amulumruptor caecigallinarius]|nr:tetratricopeptide repeat protein [Candidatus Amulumruptor caecigallinarius]MCM1396640.1 tetratricopeptide repeat protein [Candidatus Amulumruptor caecigallinarius]MCM1453302.1 tetratricopeptide repeat protein [bacterium]
MKKLPIIAMVAAAATLMAGAKEPWNALMNRAERAYNSGDYAGAEAAYSEMLRDYPESQRAMVLYNLGVMQTYQGKDAEALLTLDSAVVLDPENPRILEQRATLLYEKGDLDGARADYEKVVAADDSATTAMFMLGSIALNQNDTATALRSFEKLRALQPEEEGTLMAFAGYYTKVKDYPAAIAQYDKLIERKPEAQTLISRAANYLMLDSLDAAAADIDRAITLAPDDGEAYYMRAALAKKRYDLQGTKADAQKALELGVSARRIQALLGALPEE